MLNSSVTKVVSVLFIAVLVQVFLFASTNVINIALASGDSSDSGSSGGSSSNNDDAAFTWDGMEAINTGGGTKVTRFPGGNVGLIVGGGGGETKFYSNGDGTWNTITYPPSDSGSSDSGGTYTPTPQGCPSGTTLIGGTCCPNQYVVTTTTGSGKGASTTQTCNLPPPTPPTATISQSKATTVTGESFSIGYGRSGGGSATSCVLQRESSTVDSNGGGISNFNDNLSTPGTYTYRSQCYGPGGSSAWVSLDHTVTLPPPTLSFTADQYTIPYNTATTLRWTSQNTTSCTAGGDWSGSKSVNGSESTGSLISPVTYYLQCYNSLNQSTSPTPVTINLEYGDGASIEVNNSIVHRGSSIIATWSTGSSIPANCQLKAGSVILESALSSTTGSLDHTITGETILTIDCENGLNTDEVTVKVLPTFQES